MAKICARWLEKHSTRQFHTYKTAVSSNCALTISPRTKFLLVCCRLFIKRQAKHVKMLKHKATKTIQKHLLPTAILHVPHHLNHEWAMQICFSVTITKVSSQVWKLRYYCSKERESNLEALLLSLKCAVSDKMIKDAFHI